MRALKSLLLASTILASSSLIARADVNVVASIKPVHSLVAAVMSGVGTPGLIIDGAGSPHTYALKPSQAQMLEKADLVFWVGHQLEAFLEKPLETIAAKASSVELAEAHGLIKLKFREGGDFEEHDHDDDDGHGEEAKGNHDHDHEKKADAHDHEHKEAHEAHDEHEEHGEFDPHLWLDPHNAKAMVHEIKEALVKADPENAAAYKANAEAVAGKLDQLVDDVTGTLKPVKDQRFIVFHDAYHYFENRFGVKAAGSITVSPEVMPGAERITEIRAKVETLGAVCVFAEPQFEPKLIATVTEGMPAKSGILDPLGSSLENGPELYFSMIENMAQSVKSCLSEAS